MGTCCLQDLLSPPYPDIKKNFSFGIFVALLSIPLIIYERYVEVKLLIQYWDCGDMAWFWLTSACILLPGVIMAVAYTIVAIKNNDPTHLKKTAFFLVFPVSLVLWKTYMAHKGLKGGDDSMRKDWFTSVILLIHACLENSPQAVLQLYIIMSTWGSTGESYYYQFVVAMWSLVVLSQAVSDDQFFWINKKEAPGLENICRWLPGLYYYAIHVILRLVTYAFLAAYYHHYAVIVLAQIAWNFAIERYVCKEKHLGSNLITAFLSLVAPVAYHVVNNEKRTRKFCRWQCITFGINLAVTTTLLNLLSLYEVIAIYKLPKSASNDLGLAPLHPNVMGWGGLSVLLTSILISVLSGIFTYWNCTYCHELQEPFDQKVGAVQNLAKDKWNEIENCFSFSNDDGPVDALELETLNTKLQQVTTQEFKELTQEEIRESVIRPILFEALDAAVSISG